MKSFLMYEYKLINFIHFLTKYKFIKYILSLIFHDIIVTWEKADQTADYFINSNRSILKKIIFGHSFSLEYIDSLRNKPEFSNIKLTNHEILKFIHDELNIDSVRIGIRWNKVIYNDSIDLTYYKDCILYCLQNNIKICLNIGPIKVFRWPEVHIPGRIIKRSGIKTIKYQIPASGYIFEESKKYLLKLFQQFKVEFGEDFSDKVYCVQNDNELFNPFGDRKWTPTIEFEAEIIKLTRKFFPKAKILISFSGGPNINNFFNPEIKQVENLIKKLKSFIPENQIVIGCNFYYAVPDFPLLNDQVRIDNFSLLKFVNGRNIFNNIIYLHQNYGASLEITELQFEPWGEIVSPGLSLREFQFSLLRVCHDLQVDKMHSPLVIRFWGIEFFAMRLLSNPSKEILEIKKFILQIQNSLNS